MMDVDEIDQRLIPSLLDEQVRLLAFLYVVSGMLSMFGSFVIVHRVLRNREHSKSYDRIMLGLSCSDMIASLSYILTPFLVPQETSTRVTAMGNDVSCSVLGWLTQVGFAAIMYNAILSFYMLAIVRFSVTPGDFAARFEPYLHALTVFYFLATATIGMPFNLFTEMRFSMGCWLAAYPKGCDETGGCVNSIIAWFFVGGPLLFTIGSLVVNNIIIFVYVKRALQVTGRRGQAQIRKVATQGFLYVGACFMSYIPAFILRLMGSRGHRLSTEADVYEILVLQSSLLPLQGFLNMLIYIRPMYLRLRQAGASRSMAIRGACLEPDIPKFISEVVPSLAPVPEVSKDESSPDDDDTGSPARSASGTDDGSSEADGVDGAVEETEIPTTSIHLQPTKSILKKSSMRVDMDGSFST